MNKLFLLIIISLTSCFYNINSNLKSPNIRVLKNNSIISLPLEKYVAHVLAGEVAHNWPIEALKAQAVAIRTYALKRMSENKNKNFDVKATIHDQVFKKNTHTIFIEVAKLTHALVLKHENSLVECSFHSTCVGHTASAQSVWGRNYSYLNSHTCGYCEKSPTYNWNTSIALSELSKKLGFSVKSVQIGQKNTDERVKNFIIKGEKTINLTGQDFRMKISPMAIKSTYITNLSIKNDQLHIGGHGFGHGVGMCQYGALGMAKAGKTFKEILSHYYPQTSLVKVY